MNLFVPAVIFIGILFFLNRLSESSEDKERQKAKVLKDLIPELRSTLHKDDVKESLKVLIEKYKKIVQKYEYFEEGENAQEVEERILEKPIATAPLATERKTKQKSKNPITVVDLNKLWSSWYSDNSINLLLYVGAFLIVASASIFVGFQWGTLDGIIKALGFTLFTAAFLICGFIFYKYPTVKNAGFTFISIAALITPFNGVAWHNFYLGPNGHPIGTTWMVTSFVSIILYFFLMLYFKHRIFSYITAVGILSLVLSFVNVSGLQIEFYVLGAIFASFILLLMGKEAQKGSYKNLKEGAQPFVLSSQIVMPLSLAFGFYFAITNGMLLTYTITVSLFLSAVFYIITYIFERKIIYILISQLLIPIGVYCLLRASQLEVQTSLVIMQAVPLLLLTARRFINDRDGYFVYESNFIAIIFASLSLLVSGLYATNSLLISFTFFSLGIHFLAVYYLEPKLEWIVIALASFPIGIYAFLRYAGLDMSLSLLLIQIISLGYLFAAGQIKKNKKVSQAVFQISLAQLFIGGLGGLAVTNTDLSFSFGYISLYSLVFCIYFFLSYSLFHFKWLFTGAQMALIILIYSLCRYAGLSILISLNVVQVAGIGYMVFSVFRKKTNESESSISLSIANVAVPSIAVFILLSSLQGTTILLPEVVYSSFTGVVYYALSYVLTEKKIYQYLSEAAFLWFVYLLFMWLNTPFVTVLYIISGVCGVYVAAAYFIKNRDDQTMNIGIVGSIVVFFYALIVSVQQVELMYLSIFPMIYSLVGYILRKYGLLYGIHVFFQLIACYLFAFHFLQIEAKYELLGILLITVSIIHYSISYLLRSDKNTSYLFLTGAIVNALLAVVLTIGFPKASFVINLIVAALAFHYHIFQRVRYGLYVGNAFLILSIYQFLNGWDILRVFHPIIFIGIFIIEYVISTVFTGKQFARELRGMSLVGALVVVIYFFLRSDIEPQIQNTTLISSYFLTALFAYDAWFVREKYFGYLTSIIGMATYFWQVNLLGYSEFQVYLLPLGVYFMVLSYFTRKEKNQDIPLGLEYSGLFVLLVPLLFQSFGENGFYYSLLLGAEGIILLTLGISLKRKLYTYVGVGAIVSGVFSQTYNYVFTLPRWISTAIAGITFIIVAVFLLIKRKDIASTKK